MKRLNETQVKPNLPSRSAEKEADIRRLHELMPCLGDEGITAIYFRFWENLLIEDIANILGRSWDYTDHLIENSIRELRHGFRVPQQSKRQPIAA